MSKNTVKPRLIRKRGKRTVENPQFAAFTRRILRAYARRVAAGDVEALRYLVLLPADVDAALREAVTGLRTFGYSWAEIADRLGVSKQAVQMRYGSPAERGALDRRIVTAGMAVTVDVLVTVFVEHHPGVPPASVCPGCGYEYPEDVYDCPTSATVRPMLYRRRREDPQALARLTPIQFADLHVRKAARSNGAARRPARPAPQRSAAPSLLDLVGGGDTR
jgi:hypothetical protein